MSYPNDPQWPQQPGYQQWQGPPPRSTNGTAVAALICAFLFPPLGIILGHVARSQIKRTGEEGGGLALAALILGYIWAAIMLAIFIVLLVTGAILVNEDEPNQPSYPTVTNGYSYQLPRQSSFAGTDRPQAVIIHISDGLRTP
ncbi:MAG: DUF4190 domain-containing protein [Mycobacterium sp.]